MYINHQPKIAKLAATSEKGYQAVTLFAIVSARVHFFDMPDAMRDIKRKGAESRFLYGCKGKGYDRLMDDQPFIYETVQKWQTNPEYFQDIALRHFLQYPGLGLIKAGFVVQMVLGKIGCLDTHNMEKYGIPAKTIRYRKYYRWQDTDRYKFACQSIGDCEYLWDSWCDDMAERYPNRFDSAEEVSRMHWEIVEEFIEE